MLKNQNIKMKTKLKFFLAHYCVLSHVQLFRRHWTVACLAPLSVEFSREEYSSGLPFPAPGDLLEPEVEPASPDRQVDSLQPRHLGSPYFKT